MSTSSTQKRTTFTGVVVRQVRQDAVIWALCGDQAVSRENRIPAGSWVTFKVRKVDSSVISQICWEAYDVEATYSMLTTEPVDSTLKCTGYVEMNAASQPSDGFCEAFSWVLGTVWVPHEPYLIENVARFRLSQEDESTSLFKAILVFDEENGSWIVTVILYEESDEWKRYRLARLPPWLNKLATTIAQDHAQQRVDRRSSSASPTDMGYFSISSNPPTDASTDVESDSQNDEHELPADEEHATANSACEKCSCGRHRDMVSVSTQTLPYSSMDLDVDVARMLQAEAQSCGIRILVPKS